MKNRIISLFVAIAIIITAIPTVAQATDDPMTFTKTDSQSVTDNIEAFGEVKTHKFTLEKPGRVSF